MGHRSALIATGSLFLWSAHDRAVTVLESECGVAGLHVIDAAQYSAVAPGPLFVWSAHGWAVTVPDWINPS